MEYNDYPDSLNDSVVDSLNTDYGKLNTVDSMSDISADISSILQQTYLYKVANYYDDVLYYLGIMYNLDRRGRDYINRYIIATTEQRQVISKYVTANGGSNRFKTRSFHEACAHYSVAEINLINTLASMCISNMDSAYLTLLTSRIQSLKDIVIRYTM